MPSPLENAAAQPDLGGRFIRRIKGVRRPAGECAASWRVVLLFLLHCGRRAAHVERTMVRLVNFDEMLLRLSPVAGHVSQEREQVPDDCISRIAGWCAYLFPRVWRRRCLFRSLLILDWAHRLGISPTLNVGMQLGPDGEQGHCWLSVGDREFCEPTGWPDRYPILFHRQRSVQYWACLGLETQCPEAAPAGGAQAERGA